MNNLRTPVCDGLLTTCARYPYVPSAHVLDALAERDAAWAHEVHAWRLAVAKQERRCEALRALAAERNGTPCRYCGKIGAHLMRDCPERWTVRGQWRAILVRLLARCDA